MDYQGKDLYQGNEIYPYIRDNYGLDPTLDVDVDTFGDIEGVSVYDVNDGQYLGHVDGNIDKVLDMNDDEFNDWLFENDLT